MNISVQAQRHHTVDKFKITHENIILTYSPLITKLREDI